ncbi:M24 family metallopeptidase [Arthrobacter sp. 2RAF6]|uniref:M24 family metallopeptidase n=1 Tax=Arthrobacter sp. 2RAF6 TaxID=3233002 RepID=UPI003F917D82
MYQFDFTGRLKRYQETLREEGVDFGIVMLPGSIRYLTGFWGYATRAEYFEPGRLICLTVPQDGTPLLVVPKIERAFAEAATKNVPLNIEHHVEWTSPDDSGDAWGLVRGFIEKEGPSDARISIDKSFLTEKAKRPFEEKFEGFTVVPNSGSLERQQDVKDAEEVRLFEASGVLVASMFQVELEAIKRGGLRECDVAMLGLEHNVRACAEVIESETYNDLYVDSPIGLGAQLLTSGPRLNRSHGTASTRLIEPTDIVAIDLCRVPYLLGYRLGFGRIIAQRPLDSTEQDINATVKKSYEVGVSMLHPGTVVSDIDVAVRSVLVEGGLGPYVMHRTGRTLGTELIGIGIAEGVERKLEADMVLAIEPSVYMDGFQSRIESTFHITNEGPRLLTRVPERMITTY